MDGLGNIKLSSSFCGSVRMEINGKMFIHQPITEARDHIWESDAGDQLIFRGPNYENVEYIEATTSKILNRSTDGNTPRDTAAAAGQSRY